jgi:RNA polymerase sigma factor (sigma-70 family)
MANAVLAERHGRAGERTDHQLVTDVRRGDDRAFEQLYTRYQRRIAAYAYRMVKDHGRAEDITQEVFVSALRRMRETERPIAFKPWIYEIAKNACIDTYRRARRAEEVSFDADERLSAADRVRLVATEPQPDAAVDTMQELDHLRGAFGGLSDSHHQILVLRELEGLSYEDISERMGMSRRPSRARCSARAGGWARSTRSSPPARAASGSRRSSPAATPGSGGATGAGWRGTPRTASLAAGLPCAPGATCPCRCGDASRRRSRRAARHGGRIRRRPARRRRGRGRLAGAEPADRSAPAAAEGPAGRASRHDPPGRRGDDRAGHRRAPRRERDAARASGAGAGPATGRAARAGPAGAGGRNGGRSADPLS